LFKHFLITRFNLRQPDWKASKNNKSVLTDAWHKNRFELFIDFCFNSVASQTNKNFEWLVFFDTTTPEKYKKIIVELETKMDNFTPIFVDGMDQFLPGIINHVASCNTPYLITSRLDNDDCIGKLYIENIQKQFYNQNFTAIDFVDGYTIQTHPSVKVGKRFDQYNPFISLIEKNENPKTVWSIRHSHWKREKHVIQIRNSRVWCSIIHDENKVNEFLGYGHVNISDLFKDISINQEKETVIKKDHVPQKKWKWQSTFNLISSYWNYGFKKFKKTMGLYKIK